MNRKKIFITASVLLLVASTALLLTHRQARQKLGKPGVKTRPLPTEPNLEVLLPESVLNYSSAPLEQAPIVLETLPKDTSFGQRVYQSPDQSWIQVNVVLMGADRTSLHKPQICMPGQGFVIEKTEQVEIPMQHPSPHELPVIKLTIRKDNADGQGHALHGLFVYWFVADGQVSADPSALRRMWLSSKHLFLTGELQRWAYVTCFTTFPDGGATAAFERMQQFIAAAVPEFQTATGEQVHARN